MTEPAEQTTEQTTKRDGRRDGREHRTFTFECGVTVELRRVSVLELREFEAQVERPEPPMQEVDYGNGPVMEPNPSHPDYIAALAKQRAEASEVAMDFILWKGIKCDVDAEVLAQERADSAMFGIELRGMSGVTVEAAMALAARNGKELDETRLQQMDDKLAYIKYVLIGDDREIVRLQRAILSRSQPTEEAIAEATEGFKSDVQGP